MLGTSASMITLSAVVHMVEVRGARKYHLGETECCSVTLRGTVRLLCQAISLRMTPWQSAICPPLQAKMLQWKPCRLYAGSSSNCAWNKQVHIGGKNYKLYNLQYFFNISSFRKYRSIWDIKHFIYQNYVQMDKETSVNVSAEDKQAKNIEREN